MKASPQTIAAKRAFHDLPEFADMRHLRESLIAEGLCKNDFTSVAQVITDTVSFDRHSRTPGIDCPIPDDLPFIEPVKTFKEYQKIHAAKYHPETEARKK